ncbi:hypothetical protein GCM10028818_18710 [Spirosoma horti]
MKAQSLVLILLTIVLPSFAQKVLTWEPKEKNPANMPVDEQGEVRFREVVSLHNVAPATVIKRAYTWATNNYPSASNVIQQTKNKLVIHGSKKIKVDALIGHQLVLEAKRGQYQVTVDSLHYIFDMISPKVTRTMPIHTYGASADDFYEFYKFLGSQSDARKADGTNSKKMATTYANQQELALIEIKQMIDGLLVSLKKSIKNEGEQ